MTAADRAEHRNKGQETTKAEQSQIVHLWQEIDKLKEQLHRQNKGLAGWARRWGAVMVLVVGIFAVPRGVLDVKNMIYSRPNTKFTEGQILAMSYDPTGQTIEFGFDFTITNDGRKDDVIEEADAKLEMLAVSSSGFVPFGSTDFKCLAAGTEVTIPFPVATRSPIRMNCLLVSKLGGLSKRVLQHPGARHLAVNFKGKKNKTHTLNFCFYLTDDDVAELFESKSKVKKRFLYAKCEQAQ